MTFGDIAFASANMFRGLSFDNQLSPWNQFIPTSRVTDVLLVVTTRSLLVEPPSLHSHRTDLGTDLFQP